MTKKLHLLLSSCIFISLSNYGLAADVGSNTNVSTIIAEDSVNFTADVTLSVDANNTLTNITNDTSGQGTVSFTTDSALTITGDVEDLTAISTGTNNTGTLNLSGTAVQSISTSIGADALRLKSTNISNIGGTVTLDEDVFTRSLDFSNSTGAATINIGSSKALSVSGDVTQAEGGSNIITGDGKVTIDGTASQDIAANFGNSTSSRLGELEVTNSGSAQVALTGNAYVSTFTANTTASSINVSTILNAATSAINNDLTLGGSGSISLGTTTIADSTTLTIDNDVATSDTFTLGASSAVSINSGKTLTITGNIASGAGGDISGSSAGVGNLVLSGTSAQTIDANATIGGTFSLKNISISNIAGINMNASTVDSTSLSFTNSSGAASLVLGSTNYTLTGDISQTSGGSSEIIGTSGTVTLAGSTLQTVDSALGTSSTRLGTLVLNNSAGALLNQNSYLTSLTFTSGPLSVAGDKTIDVTDSIDLSAQTFNSKIAASSFSSIKSGDAITVDGDTTLNFDYFNNTADLDISGETEYVVLESSSGIIGTIGDVNVTDNSFLFDNSLSVSGHNVVTTVSSNSNLSATTIGTDNFNVVNNLIAYGDMNSGLLSIATSEELDEAIESIKPMQNGAFIQETLSAMDNVVNLAFERSHNLNFNEAKKEGDKEKYLGFWSKGFGGTKKQSDDGKIKGYSSSIAGLAIGFDKRLEDFDSNNVIGIAVGYSHSSIDGNSKTAKNDDSVNSYNVALYNSNGFGDGLGLYNENSLNIALNQYDTKRNIKVGTYESSSKGSFDGASYMAKTSVGYRLKLQEKLLFNPNISARYVNVSMDDYEETGAGNNSLKVRNEDFDNVIARMSFDFAYKDIYEKFKFIPKFDIYFETKLMDAKHEQSFAFVGGGSYLKNNSIDVQKNKFGLDLGVNLYSKKDHYFDLNYNFEGADGFTSHLGAFEYRYEF